MFPVIEPEAFGRGAVEAQAMGVPVIASSLGGFTETIVENETGMLVPANASQELAAALERMIDAGPEGRRGMGAKGIARAHAHYAIATLQAATLAVYQRVLAGKRTSQARGDVIDSAKEQNDDSLAQS
ncbi:MAG: glycosyltransferase [Terricaulis sp.]|nr:glycosyltransferase [Terricaulis sp.]